MILECQRPRKPTTAGMPTPWSRGMDQVCMSVCLSVNDSLLDMLSLAMCVSCDVTNY